MAQVTKDTMIGELLQIDENIAPVLLDIGMHCLGCPSSQMETIAEAAMVHGIEPDALVDRINQFLAQLKYEGLPDNRQITIVRQPFSFAGQPHKLLRRIRWPKI